MSFQSKEVYIFDYVEASDPEVTEAACVTDGVICRWDLISNRTLSQTVHTPAHGHTEVIDYGYPAASTSNGLTNGKHCSTCGTVLEPQRVIPAQYTSHTVSYETQPELKGRTFTLKDVPQNTWYYEEVKKAWELGIIDGLNETTFDPMGTLTGAAAIKLASVLHQLETKGSITLEKGSENWYDTYVKYAVENGLIDSSWLKLEKEQMNRDITRAEFVHILYNALPAKYYKQVDKIEDGGIPDVAMTDDYATEIYALYRAGILKGTDGKGSFSPERTIKRCEMAAILSRMFELSPNLKAATKSKTSWWIELEPIKTEAPETYTGYDGNIWTGKAITQVNSDPVRGANEAENTLLLANTASKYFAKHEADMGAFQIALMTNWSEKLGRTGYSDTAVSTLTIMAKESGTLSVGTANVGDIAAAKTTGKKVVVHNKLTYSLNAGMNTLEFRIPIYVGVDETIILGDTGDTAKLVVYEGVPVDDEQGGITTLGGTAKADVIDRTNGINPDKIAIQTQIVAYAKTTFGSTATNYEDHLKDMRMREMLYGKGMSIMGDSISTYKGYSNNSSYNNMLKDWVVHYSGSNGVAVNDTYWMQIIDEYDMKLIVNNSCSSAKVIGQNGSRNASTYPDTYTLYEDQGYKKYTQPGALTNKRGETPDVIVIYLGTNNVYSAVDGTIPIGTFDDMSNDIVGDDNYQTATATTVTEAYDIMVHKIKDNYPDADIFLMTKPNMNRGHESEAEKVNALYESVLKIAEKYGAYVADLYNSEMSGSNYPNYAHDGTHPNAKGMDVMSRVLMEAMLNAYAN